ncbi:oxidoreductase-like protein [Lepidopterella palustris CBS 459.81]|uniref:Oxidoreductase-like protein n=1 Tax=Lepidopterella palustris CBS 459.81 TaxID=1314670 RepID=A0A8E2EI03_9PEZI|nr:oxidoreductase-like protein [Lepidopterella palustris CBS 459.81]
MLNFGVIGTGWITASFVASAHASNKWTLRAVYSRHPDTAKHFASKYETTDPIHIHTTLSSLASDPSVQAVYIASPNSLHYEQAKILLEAKKHVILEKPATSTSVELDKLFEIAKENEIMLIEAYRHLHECNFKALKAALPRLGPIYGASFTYAQYSSRYDAVLNGAVPNIFSLDYSGGALVDLGVYPIAAAVSLFGAPTAQFYFPVMISTGADGGGLIVLQYEGFAVQINASKVYNSSAVSEVYGEKGTLAMPSITDIASVKFLDARKKETEEEVGGEKVHLNLLEEAVEFARVIEEGDRERAGELEGISRAVVRVTEDLRRRCGLVFKVEKE